MQRMRLVDKRVRIVTIVNNHLHVPNPSCDKHQMMSGVRQIILRGCVIVQKKGIKDNQELTSGANF